jgi:hypothetical protein
MLLKLFDKFFSKIKNSASFRELLDAHLQKIRSGVLKCASLKSLSLFNNSKLAHYAQGQYNALQKQVNQKIEAIKDPKRRQKERAATTAENGILWRHKFETLNSIGAFLNATMVFYCKKNNISYVYDTDKTSGPLGYVEAKYARFTSNPKDPIYERIALQVKQANRPDITPQIFNLVESTVTKKEFEQIDKITANMQLWCHLTKGELKYVKDSLIHEKPLI